MGVDNCTLADEHFLGQSPLAKQLKYSGAKLRQHMTTLMTTEEPPKPLTRLHQAVLFASYIETPRHYSDVMERLHMTRTTYYRHLNDALETMAGVILKGV